MKFSKKLTGLGIAGAMAFTTNANADICADISFGQFQNAVQTAYAETLQFGFGLGMWATLMNLSGDVCYVYSVRGGSGSQVDNNGLNSGRNAWLGSRVISAQKANTANAFSLNGLAISTGAISATVYPGGSLYGLQHSNPVDATVAYAGDATQYGTSTDPMVGTRVGGINVFGGGVPLYNPGGKKDGAVGVSGDTSCRDHAMAYRLRAALGYDFQPNDDGLEFVDTPTALFQQPACGVNDPTPSAATNNPTGANDFGSR